MVPSKWSPRGTGSCSPPNTERRSGFARNLWPWLMAFGGGASGYGNRATVRPISRWGFLQAGALCLVGLLSPLAGCGGQTPERGGGRKTAVREPQALGASGAEGEKVEVRVDGGAASGVLDAARGATAAVVMVGGMAGGVEGPSGIYPKLAERFASARTASRPSA
jgi:hypothetical protein